MLRSGNGILKSFALVLVMDQWLMVICQDKVLHFIRSFQGPVEAVIIIIQPVSLNPLTNSFSSMAFIGLPWPRNNTGIFSVLFQVFEI